MARTLSQALAPMFQQLRDVPKQARFAAGQALRDTGFEVRRGVQTAMRSAFDRPTPFVLRSVRVSELLDNGGNLGIDVFVSPTEAKNTEGTTSVRALRPQVFGGSRLLRQFELRLQRINLMQGGTYAVPSADLLAGNSGVVDRYGNIKPAFYQVLLSYLQAFSEAGFDGNMSQRRRDAIAARGRNANGYATINGVVYFVSRPWTGEIVGRGSWQRGRQQHLPAGIWAKRGIGGGDVYPVFLFVRAPRYQARLRFFDIADNIARRTFPERFEQRLAVALRTAK